MHDGRNGLLNLFVFFFLFVREKREQQTANEGGCTIRYDKKADLPISVARHSEVEFVCNGCT